MRLKTVQGEIVHRPPGADGLRIEAFSTESSRHDGEQDLVAAGLWRAFAK